MRKLEEKLKFKLASSAMAFSIASLNGNSAMAASTLSGPISQRSIPDPLYGITMDAVDNAHLPAILVSLEKLSYKPTTHVVFDEYVDPSYYKEPVTKIYQFSYVMGEILDSLYVEEYSVEDYLKRTEEYLDALGSIVDIWEIGNEINRDGLGDASSVVEKITGAYDRVKRVGGRSALTLYYNQDCFRNQANEMFEWADLNIPTSMKQGLDYVFISYYEDDCNDLQPDWVSVFQKLAQMFPNSKLGFGEVGTKHKKRKASYIQRYYSMHLPVPRYVGGYFWWYGRQDFVPWTNPLWTTLNNTIRGNMADGSPSDIPNGNVIDNTAGKPSGVSQTDR